MRSTTSGFDWSPYPTGTQRRLETLAANKDCEGLKAESFTNLSAAAAKTYHAAAFNALRAWLDKTIKEDVRKADPVRLGAGNACGLLGLGAVTPSSGNGRGRGTRSPSSELFALRSERPAPPSRTPSQRDPTRASAQQGCAPERRVQRARRQRRAGTVVVPVGRSTARTPTAGVRPGVPHRGRLSHRGCRWLIISLIPESQSTGLEPTRSAACTQAFLREPTRHLALDG